MAATEVLHVHAYKPVDPALCVFCQHRHTRTVCQHQPEPHERGTVAVSTPDGETVEVPLTVLPGPCGCPRHEGAHDFERGQDGRFFHVGKGPAAFRWGTGDPLFDDLMATMARTMRKPL